MITESGTKLPAGDLETIKTAVADAKKVFENKAALTAEMKTAFDQLQAASHKSTEALYKAGAAQGDGTSADGAATDPAANNGSGAKKDDDVIDADFKDVN